MLYFFLSLVVKSRKKRRKKIDMKIDMKIDRQIIEKLAADKNRSRDTHGILSISYSVDAFSLRSPLEKQQPTTVLSKISRGTLSAGTQPSRWIRSFRVLKPNVYDSLRSPMREARRKTKRRERERERVFICMSLWTGVTCRTKNHRRSFLFSFLCLSMCLFMLPPERSSSFLSLDAIAKALAQCPDKFNLIFYDVPTTK